MRECLEEPRMVSKLRPLSGGETWEVAVSCSWTNPKAVVDSPLDLSSVRVADPKLP